jgi:6-phosphogluconate dehydrogenase
MDIGIVGLSGASGNVARRLAHAGVRVFGFDADGLAPALADDNVLTAMPTAVALARALSAPRVVWMNVPPGSPTELMIEEVWPELAAGGVIVDVGAARYQDAQRRAAALAAAQIHFVDCAIAAVADNPARGHVLLFGGSPAAARILAPIVRVLAPEHGFLHCGPAGSGHFVRMILDGVERAALHATAEGVTLLAHKREFALDVAAIAETWRRHGGASSSLLALAARILAEERSPVAAAPIAVGASAARGVVREAMEQGVAAPVLSLALMLQSGRASGNAYAERLLAAMSERLGSEPVPTRDPVK